MRRSTVEALRADGKLRRRAVALAQELDEFTQLGRSTIVKIVECWVAEKMEAEE